MGKSKFLIIGLVLVGAVALAGISMNKAGFFCSQEQCEASEEGLSKASLSDEDGKSSCTYAKSECTGKSASDLEAKLGSEELLQAGVDLEESGTKAECDPADCDPKDCDPAECAEMAKKECDYSKCMGKDKNI
jgi:hypothetical protein